MLKTKSENWPISSQNCFPPIAIIHCQMGKKNPTETYKKVTLLKQEQKIQRKYFVKKILKNYLKVLPKEYLNGENVSA